ncbi:MAG TPA: hypothetical protein VGR94_10270 [Candidatus Acidoferrales bacterium]|nr:hypothetical protein [Candidatus Acidoferrales bacterium]
MRYPKDSIQLSQSRDLPLLRQILYSEFVTHSQLFDFMRLNHYERSRKSFDWRLRRMVDRALVRRQTTPGCPGEFVYSVASGAAMLLQARGEYCLIGRSRFNGKEAERSVFHAIGLNEIQLSVLRAGLLVRWIGSMEVRSQNELTGFGFAKDYDAVVTVRSETGEQRFALEYERSPKKIKYYRDVAASLGREAHVNHVLYLVCNYDLLQFISSFFRNTQCHVFFGLVKDWHTQLLDMPVSCSSATRCFRFRETLDAAATRTGAAAISR